MTTFSIECSTVCHTAHRILNHPGKCRWLHGHSYHIKVRISSFVLNGEEQTVLDFSDVKKSIIARIDQILDHRVLLSKHDPLVDILEREGQRVVQILGSTSCENLAACLAREAQTVVESITAAYPHTVWISSVVVSESPTTSARVTYDSPPSTNSGDFLFNPG